MTENNKIAYSLGALLLCSLAAGQARAISITQTGLFTADNQAVQYQFNVPTAQTLNLFTTSYGGGANLNGTTTVRGGFVPVLTLYSVSSGKVIATDGADGLAGGCRGGALIDTTTHMCDDAFIMTSLSAGNYILALTEFPNGASPDGTLAANPQFQFQNNPSVTGDFCGVPGGMFLQADVAPCVQRTGNYAFDIGSVPEPSTLWLALPALAFPFVRKTRLLARS